jgi:hypothetical protein
MPNVMPISGAVAGQSGSHFRAVLTFAAVAVGTYVINNTNFAGLGIYLPGILFIATGTPANVTLTISDGTADRQIYGAGGGMIYADGVVGTGVAGCVKLTVATGATNIYIFPVGMY